MHLARRFRAMAGFSDEEIAELVDIAAAAQREAEAKFAERTPTAATA